MESRVALVVGVTGMVGLNLSSALVSAGGWPVVYGLSRRSQPFLDPAVIHVPCDLSSEESCLSTLPSLTDVTHVFYTTWRRGKDEEENIELNGAMMSNLVTGLMGHAKIQHVVMVTGTKHYMGPFSAFAKMGQTGMIVPFTETLPRLPCPNFYYTLEDLLFSAARENDFTWSVARPAMIVGFAPGNAMNMMTSIAVYASLCAYTSLPFIFPGGSQCLDVVLDCVDAKLLARHVIWQVDSPSARNQAFNVANGDVFVWRHLWEKIAAYFGIEAAPYPGHVTQMEELMGGLESTWAELVRKHGLKQYKMADLATWWMVNASMAKTSSCVTGVTKSREMGFLEYVDTPKCIFRLFDYLRENKYIP